MSSTSVYYVVAGIMASIVFGAGGWVAYDLIKNGRWWNNERDERDRDN